MAVLHVRGVPEDLYQRLKDKAMADGRSISAEAILLLRQALAASPKSQHAILAAIASRRLFSPASVGAPPSDHLIREDRER